MTQRIEHLAEGVTLCPGDCLAALKTLEADSVDACVTDPPYHLTSGNLAVDWGTMGPNGAKRPNIKPTNASGRGHKTGFMGKEWDGGDIAFRPELWREVLRVLKPGAHLLSFGGTRTYHRMACAIEDAGFEIRDCVQWIYGSGFPKSLDVSKAIDKAAGARGSFGEHKSERHAQPRHYADGMERPCHSDDAATERNGLQYLATSDAARQWSGFGTALKPACELICLARKPLSESTICANVLKWGTGVLNIDGCRVDVDRAQERQYDCEPASGLTGSNSRSKFGTYDGDHKRNDGFLNEGRWPANVIHDGSDEVVGAFPETHVNGSANKRSDDPQWGGRTGQDFAVMGDSGSAARFFYTAKADADDRLGSKHPTVKPLDLMQYLVRLVTPPKGLVLDPFAGTGTTGEACIREGMRAILIEREEEYQEDIRRRMRLAMTAGPFERAFESQKARNKGKPDDHGPLFCAVDQESRGGASTRAGGARASSSSPSIQSHDRTDRIEVVKP